MVPPTSTTIYNSTTMNSIKVLHAFQQTLEVKFSKLGYKTLKKYYRHSHTYICTFTHLRLTFQTERYSNHGTVSTGIQEISYGRTKECISCLPLRV